MKMFKTGALALMLCAAALTGCLERNFIEDEGILTVDTREMVVPADMYEGPGLVTDTLYVTSNRSWSVIFDNPVDWVEADTTGHEDMARVSEITPLVFRFKDNEGSTERTATARLCCEDGEKYVTLRQEPISPRLVLTSSTDGFGSVIGDGDKLTIEFNTNVAWTASVKTGSTAKVTLSKSSGSKTGSITATVAENSDLDEKHATVVLSAAGCDPVEIPIGQLAGFPYFYFTDEVPDPENPEAPIPEHYATAGVPHYRIPIKTNSSWTAELVSVSGWPEGDVKVTASGTKSNTEIIIGFPATHDFSVAKGKIVVKVKAEGVEGEKIYTFWQEPCIKLRWWDEVNDVLVGATAATYPFSSPPLNNTYFPTSKGSANKTLMKPAELNLVLKDGGFTFTACSTQGYWRNGSTALMFGGAIGDYLKMPVIPGRRLYKIHYRWGGKLSPSASTFLLHLEDASGNAMEEASLASTSLSLKSPTSAKEPVTVDWVFPSTQAGVQYKLVADSANNFSVGDITLYYE